MNENPFSYQPSDETENNRSAPPYYSDPNQVLDDSAVKSYTAPSHDRYTVANADVTPTMPPKVIEKPAKKEKRTVPLSVAILSGTAASILSGVLVALIMVWGMGFGGLMQRFNNRSDSNGNAVVSGAVLDSTGTSSGTQSTIVVGANQASAEAVADKAGPSVVSIVASASVNYYFYGTSDYDSEGSGIIYSQDGYIITNYHVIEDSVQNNGTVAVHLPSDPSEAYDAAVVGYDISSDLAVLKIDQSGLPAIELGNSDNLKVGQSAIAIGSPGGMDFMGSVSMGIISGLDRTLQLENSNTEINLIQTDAAINPGNSGGALVNSEGKLIGINSAKMASDNFEGMGFAIPVNHAITIVDRIVKNVDAPKPYIGIEISTYYDSQTLQLMGYPEGVVVADVTDDSPAQKAGVLRSDIITQFNGVALSDYSQFNSEKLKYQPGETIELTIYRRGKYYNVSITLGTANS